MARLALKQLPGFIKIADLCGNTDTCAQNLLVDDQVNPNLTCPTSINAICDISEKPAYSTFAEFQAAGGSANDDCAYNPDSFILLSEVSDNNTCPETVTRTYQISDFCGNTATCTQQVVINDTQAPTLNCPGTLSFECTADISPVYADYAELQAAGGSASDNCGVNTSSFTFVGQTTDGGSCPETITRTYQIEDLCGEHWNMPANHHCA